MRKCLFASFILVYIFNISCYSNSQSDFRYKSFFLSQQEFVSVKMAYVSKLTTIEKIQHVLLNTNVPYWLLSNKTNNRGAMDDWKMTTLPVVRLERLNRTWVHRSGLV